MKKQKKLNIYKGEREVHYAYADETFGSLESKS